MISEEIKKELIKRNYPSILSVLHDRNSEIVKIYNDPDYSLEELIRCLNNNSWEVRNSENLCRVNYYLEDHLCKECHQNIPKKNKVYGKNLHEALAKLWILLYEYKI